MKVLLVLVCLLSAATIAQNSEDKSGSGKDEMAEYSRMTEMLAGTWSVVWTKQGEDGTIKTTGQGEERWYAGPGGSPFIEENRATVNGKPSNDYASVWWNTKAQKMEGLWCAAINDEGCNGFAAVWEGQDLVFKGEWELKGVRRRWREVFSFDGRDGNGRPTKFKQTLYIAEPGQDLKQVEQLLGTRVSASRIR